MYDKWGGVTGLDWNLCRNIKIPISWSSQYCVNNRNNDIDNHALNTTYDYELINIQNFGLGRFIYNLINSVYKSQVIQF